MVDGRVCGVWISTVAMDALLLKRCSASILIVAGLPTLKAVAKRHGEEPLASTACTPSVPSTTVGFAVAPIVGTGAT